MNKLIAGLIFIVLKTREILVVPLLLTVAAAGYGLWWCASKAVRRAWPELVVLTLVTGLWVVRNHRVADAYVKAQPTDYQRVTRQTNSMWLLKWQAREQDACWVTEDNKVGVQVRDYEKLTDVRRWPTPNEDSGAVHWAVLSWSCQPIRVVVLCCPYTGGVETIRGDALDFEITAVENNLRAQARTRYADGLAASHLDFPLWLFLLLAMSVPASIILRYTCGYTCGYRKALWGLGRAARWLGGRWADVGLTPVGIAGPVTVFFLWGERGEGLHTLSWADGLQALSIVTLVLGVCGALVQVTVLVGGDYEKPYLTLAINQCLVGVGEVLVEAWRQLMAFLVSNWQSSRELSGNGWSGLWQAVVKGDGKPHWWNVEDEEEATPVKAKPAARTAPAPVGKARKRAKAEPVVAVTLGRSRPKIRKG